jgi:hypothetical protein
MSEEFKVYIVAYSTLRHNLVVNVNVGVAIDSYDSSCINKIIEDDMKLHPERKLSEYHIEEFVLETGVGTVYIE